MRSATTKAGWLGLVLALGACGGGGGGGAASETTPESTTASSETPASSSGDETASTEAAAPAAPPPRVRVIHASADANVGAISVSIDSAEPFATGVAYGTASGYVAVASGRHNVYARGAEDESGMAPTLGLASDVLEDEHAYTVFFVTQGSADAPFALYTGDDDDSPPAEGAAIRFFHALEGVDDVDFCTPGSGRGAGTALFADVARNALGTANGLRYTDLPAGESATVQVRQHSSTVCSGRMIGVAHFPVAVGTSYTAVAIGRSGGRGRGASPQLLVCRDAPDGDGACEAVALSAR